MQLSQSEGRIIINLSPLGLQNQTAVEIPAKSFYVFLNTRKDYSITDMTC